MRVALMQPYFFPYIGYFQMLNAVDHFVFYDDVNFIKGGWINRNRILVNGQPHYFSVQLIGASSSKQINKVGVNPSEKLRKKTLSTIQQNYSKAPFFEEVYPWVETTLLKPYENIHQLAGQTVVDVANYLGLPTTFHFSSKLPFAMVPKIAHSD